MKTLLVLLIWTAAYASANAQCANGSCSGGSCSWPPAITIAEPSAGMAWSDGWFRHQDGHVELWCGGKLLTFARPGDSQWEAVIRDIPEGFRATLGLVSIVAKCPKECVCKPGQCNCENCPKDCIAARSQAQTTAPMLQ